MKLLSKIKNAIKNIFTKTKESVDDLVQSTSASALVCNIVLFIEKFSILYTSVLSVIGMVGGLIYYRFGEAPGPPVLYLVLVSFILLIICVYINRDKVIKWIKDNKKKASSIAISIGMITAGSTLMYETMDEGNPPTITDLTIADESTGNALDLYWNATVSDIDGDRINWTIECSNSQSSSGNGSVHYKTASLPDDGDDFTLKWATNTYSTLNIEPIAGPSIIDINGDGLQEVFLGGKKQPNFTNDPSDPTLMFVCINGTTGAEIWDVEMDSGYASSDNNNFFPMVYDFDTSHAGYEVIPACGIGYQLCWDADDGSEIWNVTTHTSGWHQQGFIDYGTNVTLFIVDGESPDTDGVFKVNASTGALIDSEILQYTCWGGVSIADVDSDGDYEIYLGGNPDDLRCFNESLDLQWERTDLTMTSQSVAIADVIGDSNLDIITCDQLGDDKVYILNSLTGATIQSSATTKPWHLQPSLGQTQDDDSWQYISGRDGTDPWVYDIDSNSYVKTLEVASGDGDSYRSPFIMDIIEGGYNEIVCGEDYGHDTKIWQWDGSSDYDALEYVSDGHTNTEEDGEFPCSENQYDCLSWIIASDVDYDGYKEVIAYRGSKQGYGVCQATMWCYETNVEIQNPRPTTNIEHQSFRRLQNDEYYAIPGDPTVSYLFTENDGVKSLHVTGLSYSTEYTIWINATDGVNWNNDTYTFTTKNLAAPTGFSATASGSTTVNLAWTKESEADKTYIERHTSQTWSRGDGTEVYNDTSNSYADTVADNDNVYYYRAWSWEDTLEQFSADNAYDFTWGELTLKWEYEYPSNPDDYYSDGQIAAYDIDDDGDLELFFIIGEYGESDGDSVIYGLDDDGVVLWSPIELEYGSGSANHISISIADVDGDGNYEFCHGGAGTYMRNCENGTLLWSSTTHKASYHHSALVCINDTYYLYVSGPDSITPTDEYVKKLYASNGTQVEVGGSPVEFEVNHISNSGFSIADLDNDGFLEVIIGERSAAPGDGMTVLTENLALKWNQDILCSSNCIGIMDVNDDGYLDTIAQRQGSGDYYVNSGEDGTLLSSSTGTFDTHTTSSFWDLDDDGDLEGITGVGENCRVVDVSTNTVEHTFTGYSTSEPSDICDILGDSDKEIYISCGGTGDGIGAYYDGSYQIIKTGAEIPEWPYSGWSFVADIDGDGYKNIIVQEVGSTPSIICMNTPRPVASNEPIVDTPFYGLRRANNEEYYAPISMYNATIRNDGVDYFTWMGKNITAKNVSAHIEDFDEVAEYIAIWDADTWDASDGLWDKYLGTDSDDGFTINTFDVVKVYLTDSGTQKIYMLRNPDIDYDAQRTVSLTSGTNKGYNYIGYTDNDVSTLSAVVGKSDLATGESGTWWNRTGFNWEAWIVGFTPATMNHDISADDVFIMKVSDTRSIDIGA